MKRSAITIDNEFRSLIPPLTDIERSQLEDNLHRDGCRDPLVVWRGEHVLIDGHNRFEICNRDEISYDVVELSFESREKVKHWILCNQLGRRNLPPDVLSELRGLIYNDSQSQGKRTDLTSGQNGPKLSTAKKLAKELGVSERTIKRDGQYAKAIAKVTETVPDIRAKVRSGKVKKSDVIAAAKSPDDAAEIIAGTKKPEAKPAEESVASDEQKSERLLAAIERLWENASKEVRSISIGVIADLLGLDVPKLQQGALFDDVKKSDARIKPTKDEFEGFWKAYPRKTAKKDAQEKFVTAISRLCKTMEVEEAIRMIMDGVAVYVKSIKDDAICHASTWLNGRRWEDDIEDGVVRKKPGYGTYIEDDNYDPDAF